MSSASNSHASSVADALLRGLIDYAGLFPPAALPMAEAVVRYREYQGGAHSWMLGRFVVPVARLEELGREATQVPGGVAPLRLSVIGEAGDGERIERFNARHGGQVVIDSIDGKVSAAEQVEAFESLASLVAPGGDALLVYVEVPIADDPDALVAAIGASGLRAKVRTGGVTTDAFPRAKALARFLGSCVEHNVAFKATAGLHHPMRGDYRLTYERESETGTMFGFLNVFAAALFIRAGLGEDRAARLLDERDPRALALDAGGLAWDDHRIDGPSISALRDGFAASFGSCSFDEPVDELRALGWL